MTEDALESGAMLDKDNVKTCDMATAKQLAQTIMQYMELGKIYEVNYRGKKIEFYRVNVKQGGRLRTKAPSAEELCIDVWGGEKYVARRLTNNLPYSSNLRIATRSPSGSWWWRLDGAEPQEPYLMLLLLCADKLWKQLDVRVNEKLRALGKLGFSVEAEAIEAAITAQNKFLKTIGS